MLDLHHRGTLKYTDNHHNNTGGTIESHMMNQS